MPQDPMTENRKQGLQAVVRDAIDRAPHGVNVSIDEKPFLVLVMPVVDHWFDRPWKALFIEWLRLGRTIETSAHLAGVSPSHAYYCRKQDPAFRDAWKQARKK